MKKRSMFTATAIAVLVGLLVWPLAMQAQSTSLQDMQKQVAQIDPGAAVSVGNIERLTQVRRMIEKPSVLNGEKLNQARALVADVRQKTQEDLTNSQRDPKAFGDVRGQRGGMLSAALQSVNGVTPKLDALVPEVRSGISIDSIVNAVKAIDNAIAATESAFVAKMAEAGERAIGEPPEVRKDHKKGKDENPDTIQLIDQVARGAAEHLRAERGAWDLVHNEQKLIVKVPDGTGKEVEREVNMDYYRNPVSWDFRAAIDEAIASTHTLDITGGDAPDRIIPCSPCSSLPAVGSQSNSVDGSAKK